MNKITLIIIASCLVFCNKQPLAKVTPDPKNRHSASLKRAKESQSSLDDKLSWAFFAYGPMHHVLEWEIGDEKAFQNKRNLCQEYDDTGEILTCVGISFHVNYKWYQKVLDRELGPNVCTVTKREPYIDVVCKGMSVRNNRPHYIKYLNKLLRTTQGRRSVSDFYYEKYAKFFFDRCSFIPAFFLFDTNMLSGHKRTVKIFQKSQGLVPDGKWGPKTEAACQKGKFDMLAFAAARTAQYKTFKLCWKYCNGWINRLHGQIKMVYEDRMGKKREVWAK